MPNLRQRILTDGQVSVAGRDQHIAVRHDLFRGVPAAGVHTGLPGPGIQGGIVDDRSRQADVITDVAARDEKPIVCKPALTGAEDVIAGCGEGGYDTCCGVKLPAGHYRLRHRRRAT